MYGPIHIRAYRTEKPYYFQMAILYGSGKSRPSMNFRVDVERRLVRLVYYSFYFVQFPIITGRVAL